MRINVYSQELTVEVLRISKVSNTGIEYKAVQFVLHSSPMLHHPPADDDRSAVTFWLPQSERGLAEFSTALSNALSIVDQELRRVQRSAPRSARTGAEGMMTWSEICEKWRSAGASFEQSLELADKWAKAHNDIDCDELAAMARRRNTPAQPAQEGKL